MSSRRLVWWTLLSAALILLTVFIGLILAGSWGAVAIYSLGFIGLAVKMWYFMVVWRRKLLVTEKVPRPLFWPALLARTIGMALVMCIGIAMTSWSSIESVAGGFTGLLPVVALLFFAISAWTWRDDMRLIRRDEREHYKELKRMGCV